MLEKNEKVFLHKLLQVGVALNASDIHIAAGSTPMIRLNGDMEKVKIDGVEIEPLDKEIAKIMIYSIMTEKQKAKFEDDLEIDFSFDALGVRFRCNVFNNSVGYAAAFRVIPSEIISVEELMLPDACVSVMDKKKGIVLITGPTGSGKSTTLAAMIDYYNKKTKGHIITIEDPIEFIHSSKLSLINQREVGLSTKGFNSALRSALREDPDVIMVGELRDLETIRLALTAAETGHLVLATLHSSSAAQTISRIIDVFPGAERELVRSAFASSVELVVTQRLLKAKNKRRVAAYEVMVATKAVRNVIKEAKESSLDTIIQTGKKDGMIIMEKAVESLYEKDLIDRSELELVRSQL